MERVVFYTATIITLDGTDTNAYGEPCEPGQGYTEHSGWWSPDFDFWSVHTDQDDAEPDRYPTSGDLPAAQWLADQLNHRLGLVDHVEGPTFYTAAQITARPGQHPEIRAPQDTATGRTDPVGTRTLTAAAHAHGFTDQELRHAAGLLGLTPASTIGGDAVPHRLTSATRRGFPHLSALSEPTAPSGPGSAATAAGTRARRSR